LPAEELPNNIIGTATKNLATLYLDAGRLEEGLALYEQWFDMPFVAPSPYDNYIRATVLYRLERHEQEAADRARSIEGVRVEAERLRDDVESREADLRDAEQGADRRVRFARGIPWSPRAPTSASPVAAPDGKEGNLEAARVTSLSARTPLAAPSAALGSDNLFPARKFFTNPKELN